MVHKEKRRNALKKNNFFTQVSDFFLPRFCPGCERKLSYHEDFICPDCIASIRLADDERIQIEFDRNFRVPGFISGFTALYVFEKDKTLQQIIHKLKYNHKFLIGKFLGKKIAEKLSDKIKSWRIDLIIPIPLHHLKIAERGYNQSEYIAKGISELTGLTYSKQILKRARYTETQTMLNQTERQLNMAEAFKVKNKKKIIDKIILLVDDICTTGSTLNECAKLLSESGAKKIFACTVAIAD